MFTKKQIEAALVRLENEVGPGGVKGILEQVEVRGVADLKPEHFDAVADLLEGFGIDAGAVAASASGDTITVNASIQPGQATGDKLNAIAEGKYRKPDHGTDLRDAVPDGASPSEAANAMGQAANALRKKKL